MSRVMNHVSWVKVIVWVWCEVITRNQDCTIGQSRAVWFLYPGLYGVASPGSTVDYQLENTSPGGIFPGVRFFNMDPESFDPVPWITVLLNFQHAKSRAIQLTNAFKGQELVKHQGNTYDARWQPLTSAVVGKSMSLNHHLGPEYMRRILAFTREVSITILAGQNFSEECLLGGINPYIEVQVGENDEQTYFTEKVNAGLLNAAFWNETFLLSTYEPGNIIQLFAWNDCTKDFKMGGVVLQSVEFDPKGFAGWLSLDTGAELEIAVQIEHSQFWLAGQAKAFVGKETSTDLSTIHPESQTKILGLPFWDAPLSV